jgi:site-specific recombinase XerD
MNATVNILCYKQKTLANGEHPLMIRVTKDGKRKYKSLGISVNPKHWDFKKNRPKNNCPNKEMILKIILEREAEYQKEILEMTSFQKEYTAASLIEAKDNKIKVLSVGDFFTELIQQFKNEGRIGNAKSFNYTLNSLSRFCNGKLDFPFAEINVNWLNRYEVWLKKTCTEVSIAILMRTLRSAYNKAIKAKCTFKNNYPFEEYKISKLDTKTQKRAITKADIKKIMELNLSKELFYTKFSRDIFIFSYLCAGINFTDIANLKHNNLIDNEIHYIRQKTKKKMEIPLSNEALQIINKYQKNDLFNANKNNYLFPILDTKIHKTPIQIDNRTKKVLRKINANLKLIAKLADIKADLTTYVARHSFATVLKKSGVNIPLISETLGHSDIKTTQIYLDSFDNEQIKDAFKNLL